MRRPPSHFLKQIGVKDELPTVYPVLSPRRVWLLYGWARCISVRQEAWKQAQQRLVQRRKKNNWGIAVEDDDLACWWQIINFRLNRMHYAIGTFGLRGKQVYGENGFEHVDVTDENRLSMDRYRQRAYRALKLLAERGAPLPSRHDPDADRDEDEQSIAYY